MPNNVAGYKDERTGKLYRNTAVQTIAETSADLSNYKDKISLAIQTCQTRNAATNVMGVDFGTQTETIKVLRSLNCVGDIVPSQNLVSRSSIITVEVRDKSARIIQKCMRMNAARKKFENMLKYYYHLKQLVCDEENNLKNKIYNDQGRNLIHLQYPTMTKDFEALYAVVYNYYKNKKRGLKNINEKKAQLGEELKCLKEITKHRNQAKIITEEKQFLIQLNDISKPIKIIKENKDPIYIEVPEMYIAKQFLEFYITLKRRDLNKTERVEFLHKLKETLECSNEIKFTRSIINLLNRELTLINIVKLNDGHLETLRKRIEINFQLITKQPEINPAIALYHKPTFLIKCYNCRKLKSLNRFMLKLDLTNTTICKDCRHLHNITIKQINLMPYADIFRTIKVNEARLKANSNITFFLNTEDIYYLVEIIWKGKSAISESKDITQLQLIRWIPKLNWSPSNTLLLTIEEAVVHSSINDISKVYTTTFIDNVHLKQMAARNYFKGLSEKAVDCNRKFACT